MPSFGIIIIIVNRLDNMHQQQHDNMLRNIEGLWILDLNSSGSIRMQFRWKVKSLDVQTGIS